MDIGERMKPIIGNIAKYVLRYSRFNGRNFLEATSEECGKIAAKTKSFFKRKERRFERRKNKEIE